MSVLPFLKGKHIYLRPLVEADADGAYPGWFNDEEVCRGNSHHVFPYTKQAALAYIRRAAETRSDLILAIALIADDRHIGNIALQNIHPVYRSADFAIVIGDKSAWGHGYAKEASALLCAHGFVALNLHRIACGTFEDNVPMQRLAVWLGMKEEGKRRSAVFKSGRFVDMIEYGMLAGEFRHSPAGNSRKENR